MSNTPGATTKMQQAGLRGSVGGPKILRACVVQNGQVIEELRLQKRDALTIGTAGKNSFVLSDPALPKTHELFGVRGSQYELVLTEAMRGKISVEGNPNPVDVSVLKAQGLLRKRGDLYHLPLNDNHRGKVLVGDTTIIFQFIVPPPEPAKPQLPADARGNLFTGIDVPFAAILFAIFAIEVPFLVYVRAAPPPPEVTLENIDERWASLIVPEYKPQPKEADQPKDKGDAGPAKKQQKAADKSADEGDEAAKAARKAARSKEIRKEIAGKAMLAVLGTIGEGTSGSAVADVFSGGGLGGDLASAFDGVAGVGLAAGSSRSSRGGGAGDAATIGGLATAGGGEVGLGAKAERRVGAVKAAAPEVDGSLDSEAIARVVKTRLRMVQDCYEKELKRDPTLAGKIEIEFTIGAGGRVESASVASNSMASDAVGQCIVGRIKSWRFPEPEGGSVTVTYPFIFTASG